MPRLFLNVVWMHSGQERAEAGKVANIAGEQVCDAVHVSAGRNARIVYLLAPNAMQQHQTPLLVVNDGGIRMDAKQTLNVAQFLFRFRHGQP